MKCSAAARPTARPVLTLPVKQTTSTRPISAEPVLPSPTTRSNTAASSGTAAMAARSGSTNRGATSLGFTSTAHPASSAGMASISESVSGKFHGLITPTSGYGTSCDRNVIEGCAWERPSCSCTSSGACAHHRSIAATVPPNSACASRWRPVSVASASTIALRRASSSSFHRCSTATRDSTGRAAQSVCALRNSAARRCNASGSGGTNS